MDNVLNETESKMKKAIETMEMLQLAIMEHQHHLSL